MGDTPPVKRPRRGMPAMPKWELETPPGLKRGLGSPALFGIVQGFIAASIYFGLGLVVQAALGYAWIVYLFSAALLRARRPLLRRGRLAAPGARRRDDHRALRLQRAVELHRRLGDPARLHPADRADRVRDHGLRGGAVPAAGGRRRGVRCSAPRSSLGVAWLNIRGAGSKRYERFSFVVLGDLVLQTTIVILGLALLLNPDVLTDPASVAGTPSTSDLIFAFTLTLVTFAGVDASSGLAGEVKVGRRGLKRLVTARLLALHPLRRHRARGGQRAAGRHRAALGRGQLRRRADARRGGGLRAGVAERHAADPDRRLGLRDPGDRVQRRHARPLAARLLARAQPPDPVRDRPPAPGARDPGGDHRRRRAARDRAADPGRPRVPRLDLRLRRDDLVHDRPRLGDPPALARARPRPPVQGAAEHPHRPRRAARDRRRRRADVGRRLRRRRLPARQRALGRHRLDGVRDRALRRLPRWSRASRSSSASRSPSAR